MTESTLDEIELPLDEAQQSRAAALAYARASLADQNGSVVTKSETLPKRFGTQDLIDVAQWILDGADPLAGYREEQSKRVVVIRVPDDQVEAVSALNQVPSEDFPGGLLIVPESISTQHVKFDSEGRG
jgi:hypothetical protein